MNEMCVIIWVVSSDGFIVSVLIPSCLMSVVQASGSDYTLSQSKCVCSSPAVRARMSLDYYWLAAKQRQGGVDRAFPVLSASS